MTYCILLKIDKLMGRGPNALLWWHCPPRRAAPPPSRTNTTLPGFGCMPLEKFETTWKKLAILAVLKKSFFFLFYFWGGGACLPSRSLLSLSQVLWACLQKKIKLHERNWQPWLFLLDFFSFFWGGGHPPAPPQAPLSLSQVLWVFPKKKIEISWKKLTT